MGGHHDVKVEIWRDRSIEKTDRHTEKERNKKKEREREKKKKAY